MPNPNDKVKNLYDTFVKDGYAMEPEAQFRENLKDPKKRKAAYDALVKDGYDMEPYAEFESNIGFAKAAPAPKRETPSSGQRKPASAVSASPEQPKQQKPKGTPMTEQDKIRMSLQMGQMKQQVQQGIANTNAKIGRMMEPLTQKGRERRRLGEFQARMAGTPTHVVGFNTASPAPASSGARGGSQQKPVQSEQSPQPYGVKYENGKAKTQWVLPDGTLTTSLIEANQAEYEARTARLAHQFQDRMKENGLDPNKPEDVRKQAQLDYEAPMRKAIEDEWQRAEAEDRAADEAYRKDMERAEGGSFWDRLKKSITPLGPDGMPLRRGDETLRDIKRAAKRQDTFNLEKMAQSVLQNMPQEYKDNQMLNYSRYFREHPSELKGRTVSQAAKEALQGEVYHATYERAVQARMPKSKTEFLLRKVADQPFFSQTMADNMAARLFSHSIGTEAADMDAMSRYGTDHRALDITGTVLNMAIDPTTYISGGVGSFAGKQALKLSGKMALKGASKEAAERYVGRTLAGRMVAGVAAGSANFGTFEGLKNMQQQMRLGGTLNPETGEYEFSAGDMLKATGHGMLLGSVTGTLSPVLGNVSDKLVKATESTAGKVGIRAGELMTSTVAEGTIFATPEWIENAQLADDDPRKRKAMDIWTDNMAMMIGFKVSHGIKSAPQVIAGLRPIAEPKTMEERNHNRRSFAERLRKRMDASPRDLDFTKEEREELQRNGYGDLASLFTRTPKQPTKPKAKPTMTDGKIMTFDVDYQHAEAKRVSNPEFDGYEAMERLMQDPNVSQSARAKAYYILTGRMLPMGTVTGYTTNKDANGVTVQAMTAQGEVVTSRHFKTEEEAKKEEANIMRQAELNSVDVGERYKEAAANAKVVQAAVESVAPGADFATVMRNYKAVKEGDKDAIAAYGKMVEDIDRAIEANKSMADGERPEAIRASIKEETGVDVDATLRKEPKNRTEEEQVAVEDYIKRLFPEQKSEEAGASAEAEQPMSEAESAAAAAYDQARLLWDKVEKGDTDAKAEVDAITLRMQEAYQMCEDAFGADAEMRIAEINEDPWPLINNPELSEDQQDAVLYYVNAKAAMEGVMDASNEAADGKRKEVEANVERHTHKDMGVVQPATMKVDDKPVYVVKGNVVMLPDGSGIDVRNSDQSIVICDAETGEYKFASPDQLFSLGEAIDPQTELDEAYANIQAEHEAILRGTENGESVPNLEESVPETPENVQNEGENVQQPMTDEQLHQYARGAFDEATQGKNGVSLPQEQIEQLQQHNQQMLEQKQQRKEEEANRQPTALERVPINEETGEPMFEKADRETALDALNEVTGGNDENTTAIVRAQVEQATKALEALKKKEPTKKAPSLKGSPMAMVKAQQEAEANYNTAMEEYNAQVAAAEENLNAWSRINSLMNDRKRAIREQQEAERKVREEKLHAEAVARLEEDKRIAAEKAAEQEAVGTHAVISTYNNEAASSAAGQIDMFSGDVTSKEEILKKVNEYFRNATPKEQQALIDAAVAERKRRAEAAEPAGGDEASEQATVVAGSDAEPQQPVVASEEPVKGNEADADALAKEAEEKLSERITDTEDEWTEPSEYGEIYKHRMFVDGKEVIKVDAPDKSKNYPGTYYEIDGKQFGDLYEVANYIDGNEQPLSAKIEAASAEVNTDPTEAQKEAGNYKKGHVQVGTFDITIEQPQGSVRKGTDADGKQWESKMNNTYGYIRGAVGVDGDHIDVFLSNDIDGWNGRKVFVVDQYNPDGSFDEHKVMLGFNDQDEAKGDYLANYEQGWENGRRIDITGVNLEDFEKWIESSKRKTKPFGEYSSVKKDVVEINTPEEAGYSITPSTYTNKKGKTSDVSLLTFDHDLTADQERAVKEFAKERTGEGRFAPARGWKDRESGGWMFRSEEDARKAAEMVGNEEAVADNQPMTAQELRDAVEPKKPTTSKKTASKKPANRVESVPTEEPIEPEKPKYEVSDEEMNGLMNDIRDILGIGDDEGDAGFKFRDPDELTAEQRQKLMSVGQRLAMAMVERGNESFGNYASMMVKALGDKVRPWLKAFYGGLEYVPGYDKYALTPYEEVKAFDVENFDKPTKDVMAQANMIVEEGKAQVAAEKANNELKATRNEQRKETEKQTAANTDAVAAEAKSVASEATALAETSSDEQALTGAAERVDETLDKVNEQLALLGYYEADEVEKDYNEAYGYMRNAEKKAVKDAANLASQLISDLNLSHYEASHSKQTDKKGNRKKKPLAVSNISPIGGDVSIHLPLEEGRELYLTIGVEPRAAKGVDGFGGSDLEVTHIMFRVDHPEGTGNDRYGRNVFVDSNVTYSDLLKQVQREAYKYLIGSGVTNEGEYAAGDKVQYSTDGGRTWTDAVVVQPNDEGGIRIDTGLAPVMWVNAHPDQLRHKPSESAEPKHEADGDFYEDGINEDAVAALPEDTAIQLHVVDILNPGMTDHSMKSKIESLNTLLPKISDKKLSELDKEYGDDKDMGTHIKAEVARRAKDGGVQPTSSEEPADKPKPASKKNATKKVKPEQPVGDLFAGLFDNTLDNGLQGNDEAVRTETMPADNSGQQQGLRESQGSPRKTAAQEGGRPDGGRGGQSTGKDRAVSAGLHGLTQPKNTRNNHSERGADHAPTSVNGRIEANIKAIELAHELLESGETATPEQMSVLRQFSGWGGLGAAFSDGGYDWKQRERNKKIRELLGEEAYEQAVMSANSAYYTPAYVVDTLWDIANQLGFKGGNILEGSAGIGNILGQMPTMVSERSNIQAIEIDGTSGGILSLLYPDAKVQIQGFEQTRIPNGSVDLAITNVPFVTGLRVNDITGDSDLSKKFHNIHDFCIAKNVRKLREGGLGIFISSNGTLDNSKALRDWVVNEGGSDFIGAFRMNNKTFGGTTVTSDIIVIRKRVNGQKSAQAIDVSSISGERTAEYEEPGARKAKQLSMDYNKYFIEHPDHMAGEMRFAFEEGDTFRPTSKGLYPVSGKDQGKMLVDFVKSFTEEDSSKATTTDHHDVSLVLDASADGKKLGEMYMKDGQIVLASFGGYYPLEVNDKKIKGHTKQECFTAYAAIKSALADVMQYQTENESDAGLKPLIAKLNKAYDAFVNTYGHFNKNNQLAWLRNDVDYPNVFSLETYKEQGDGKGGVVKTYDKADVMKGRVVEKESEPHPENVKDGVVVSMFKNGRIDVPYIASQLGKSEAEVKREIIDSGLGFEDPTTRQMEVSFQYLSGNVREKLKQAEANNENGEYSKNIKALQDVVPMNIPAHLIDFTLGSSWLDPKLYDEYVKERTDIDVHFTAAGGTWFMKAPTYGVNVEKNRAMGIVSEMLKKTIMGHELISAAIQNKSIIVSRTEKHYDGTTETITDREATAACAAKIDEIRQDFKDWARGKMQSDADLSARMEQEYNDRFNNYVPMSIPDDFVPEYFGGATHKFKMRSHQGKAIVRGTMQPLLLAHEVGTGKTFTLISTAMEMRRLGTARKPMIVVQNATVGQFAASAKELYPNAKILTLEDNDRNAEGRKNFYAKIKYNDWDMIVVPQSTFEFIPDSDERQMQFVQDKIDEKMLVLEQMREADSSGRDPITRRAEKELADLQAEMAALSEGISKKRTANNEKKKAVAKQNAAVKAQEMLDRRTDDVENFDDMGIDALLIDEAHEYKHLGFATAMQRGVKGVDPSYSKKSQGVYLKTQAILEKNNGRNVIFATGTPISNTAAEIWTFMRYLMPKDTMKEYGIYYFDDFVRNFGNIQQMPEFNTSGKFKEVNRFAGYVNLPELVRIWSGVADTVLTKDQTELVKKIPEMEGGKAQDIYLPQTRALRSVMKYVREELERFDQMSGKEKKENSSIPLTMYGIAQGAAVDARLVEMHAEDDPRSKTNEAVRQTLRSLKETDDYKGTVAIFADHYQNKRSGFNLYEDIKKKLIQQGVPESEVIVMKPGMTIKKKLEIFDKVNRGEVRVILGSTATLGTGVNIQERLHTLIHLDAPNRPMDYTQRNGRILRQGNLHKQWNKPVRVLRFGVEDSLDVTAYQRLKTKGAIADSVMEGDRLMQDSMNNRVLEEEEDVFGDTVAQLSGSEYALLKNNAEKNVRKYESRKKQWEADQTYIHNAKPKLEGQIKAAEQRAEEANAQLLAVQKAFPDGKFTEITVGKLKFASVDAMADFIKEHNKKILDAVKAMKENPGNNVQTNALTLSLGGYDFVVKTEMSRETVNNGGLLFAEIHRRMSYSCPELGLNNVPVKQSLLRNAVEDITENVITGRDFAERFDIATRMVQHGKSELEQLKQREGKPFEFGKELEEAKRQFEEYSEAMKVEMAEKEKKYAEMDASVDAATDVVADDEDEAAEDKTKFRLLDADDPKAMELESLSETELVPVYRNVQAFEDDALGSPMAFTDAETGERRTLEGRRWNYSAPPKVELTEEQQRKLDELNKNGYIMVDGKKSTELQINDGLKFVKPKTKEAQLQYFLKKNPEDKGLWAAYDPYDHAIETPLNTQFGEAYKRPNLVVVRSLIPKSEIDEPFHADYALLPTGAHQWNNGRTLYLSRWSKIDKVLTREEEAKLIDEYWKKHPGKREELKTHRDYNRFVPQVRRELEKMGYRFELDGKELTPEESLALDKQNWESRDIIPGREGHTPFVSNEDIARINAKMAGKWVGEPKEAMESAMSERVTELSERLHTPVRIIRTEEEVAALPSVRQRRMKGSFNPMTGEVTIVVPNNANMADVENTFVHEVVGHDGLRVLFPDEAKLNNALDELYRVSKDEIRGTIDRMAQKMYDAEVDRIREKKRKEHVANGEDANASYYADMAAAHAEAGKKREQFKRDATEEYGADLAGRIGEKGFEKMSAEELTFWGKLKAMLQKALQKLLDGLKIPGKRKWGDKDWAFVLHEAYKRKKNGGKPNVFDAADTEVMRRKTGFGDTKFSDGKNKSSEPKPIGHSTFGSVYNQFKGKVLQAVKFLVNHESGDLLGVFHRNDVGDIDMVWGNEGGGLCHILNKHINDKDFPTVKDLVSRIEDIINKGEVDERHSNADKLVLVKDGYLVTIRRNVREKGIKIADKNWVLTAYNKDAPATTKAPVDGTYGSTAVAPGTSSDAKLATKSEINEFSDNNVADEGIMFRDGDMGLEETITKMKVEASQANADNWQAKQDAMRAIGGNLNKLRQAMARQRAYDLSTVKSITDLAKVLLENGFLDDLSKYETKRILSAVNNVHGKQDVSDYVQKVMDIMVDNQLRMGANQLGKLLSIRGSRVDARGIEVQGQLDPEGQRIAQVVRKATSLPKENIEERIADCTNRMSSDDNAVAEEAAIEYSGLLLAHQFVEDITESKAEEKALRESIKEAKADLDAGTMEADAYREYVESTNDAIRQNKIERAEAYRSIVEQVGGVLGGSVERAKAWREAEKQRVETIHHNANSDMTGRPNDEHHKESKAQKIANNSIVRFVLAPLGTFDQMLRMFGKKSVNGEGYLWNRYMRGWVEATEKEYNGYQNALKTLDEKVSEVFDKKMKWGDLFSLERNLPKATVTFWDGGEQKAHELTQGNLLYIYMVDKMADGRMKLRRMGITEEDVENIKEFVDPRFLELADWMQDEFLVEKRNEYNEVHKRMFGASMAAIENYFPLKILANARIEEVDVADDTTDTALPATSTGSIIKRRRNNLALDVMGADAFSVILDHIQQMERWASFAEFNRDLNTLLSYKRFRNQVMNMTSVYGGGKTLWKNFRNVCSMAAGAYRPPIAALDKAAVNVAKGVTAAKVSFRVFTALKQFLSMPAYLSDSSPVYLAGNIANPIGAWKWSMENLPLFEKRWKSRMAGDPRLMKSEMDWKMWQNRAVEIASRIGMSPNAFVDALTVAIGAHSMYQTKKKKYLRYGYDEETAEKRAKQDATILFNQTQQSSESAFLSTMQTDRSWLSVLFTVFRNSSMSYTRQLYDALRNLKHRFEPGYKGLTEEYLAKQMRRDGIDPDKADQNAKSEYRRSLMRDIVRVGVFGYLLQFAWNLGAYLPYLLLGDDKDEKSDMWHDIFCHTMFGSIEGLTGGDVMSAVGNGFAKGEGLNLFSASKDMPLSSDLQNIVNKWNKDKVAAMNDVTNLMVQSGIGVNPQSLTDAVVAIMDYCGDDANTSRECALLITRIINCPQSQIDKIYFDELNATAAEAQGMTPAEIAERYARYKMHRGAPLTGWAYTDEARDSVMTAQQNRVLTKAKEKLNSRMETEETKQLLSDYDAIAKQETALSKIKKTDRAAYREGMKQLRQSNDMRQHMRLKRYKHDMNELTSKYLRCKSAEERDSIVSTMFSTRAKMLEDIGRLKQQ
jgi:N12 class adenine-specific DNA methylase/PAS domain-containing protein